MSRARWPMVILRVSPFFLIFSSPTVSSPVAFGGQRPNHNGHNVISPLVDGIGTEPHRTKKIRGLLRACRGLSGPSGRTLWGPRLTNLLGLPGARSVDFPLRGVPCHPIGSPAQLQALRSQGKLSQACISPLFAPTTPNLLCLFFLFFTCNSPPPLPCLSPLLQTTLPCTIHVTRPVQGLEALVCNAN